MRFLTPAYLIGAILIALPIVLHWLRRDVAPRVPFTAVHLLPASQIERSRRRRLRDILLLAARVIALVLLAGSFARPYLVGSATASRPTIVAIDRSFSMAAPGRMERARELARQAVAEAGDGVAVVTFDQRADTVASIGSAADARVAVDQVQPGFAGTRYGALFDKVAELLADDGHARLVVVTDMQRAGFDGGMVALADGVELILRDVGAPAGTAQVIRSADGLSAQVSWTPQTAVPDASAVSGYSVLAIDTTVTPAAQAGVRTDAAAKQATIGSLTNGKIYTFEVRSLAQDGSISKPFTIGTAGGGTQTPGAEAGITLTPAGGATTETALAAGLVTAAGSPAGGQIWFTDDGTAAVTGDALAETAKLYTAPVPVTAPVHLSFAYFNPDGNVAQSSGFYKPGASQPAPAVPQNVA